MSIRVSNHLPKYISLFKSYPDEVNIGPWRYHLLNHPLITDPGSNYFLFEHLNFGPFFAMPNPTSPLVIVITCDLLVALPPKWSFFILSMISMDQHFVDFPLVHLIAHSGKNLLNIKINHTPYQKVFLNVCAFIPSPIRVAHSIWRFLWPPSWYAINPNKLSW